MKRTINLSAIRAASFFCSLAVLFIALYFATLWIVMRVTGAEQPPAVIQPILSGVYVIVLLPLSLFASNVIGYLLLIFGVGGLLLVGMMHPENSALWKLLAGAGIVALLFFALMPPLLQIKAAKGYEMQLVTKGSFGMGGLHLMQSLRDIKPCRYTVEGWNDETLYYSKTCTDGAMSIWKFRPNHDRMPRSINSYPILTRTSPENSRDWILHSAEMANSRHLWLDEHNIALSPDGSMVAAVSKNLYGPENVVIVSKR